MQNVQNFSQTSQKLSFAPIIWRIFQDNGICETKFKQNYPHPGLFWFKTFLSQMVFFKTKTENKKGQYMSLYSFFSYNTCIPNFSYTTLYTVVCEKMTFLWISYTNHIPKPIFTALYTAFGFVFWQILNTYQLLWHTPVIYHSTNILICLRWCGESFWLKNYIILLDIPLIYWWCGHYGIFCCNI